MRNTLLIKSLKFTFREHKNKKNKIINMAKENMYQQTLRTSLGIGWVFFRDIVYFTAFILFRYVMSGSGTIEDMNFILYLMLGIIPWNFMNECLNGAVMAIKSSKGILSSIKFPITILPTVDVLAIFMKRLFTLIVMFIIIILFGDIRDVTWWMFIYYFITMFIFMCIWNLIFSSLVAISNDFEQLYRAFTSIMFFSMPILWSFEILKDNHTVIQILKLNPFVYIIEGFRDACVTGTLPELKYSLYFWGVAFVMLCVGSILQYKLKSHYIDLI